MFREKNVVLPSFNDYLFDIKDRFCPFLSPSIESDCNFFSSYDVDSPNLGFRESYAMLFTIAVIHTEVLRSIRRNQPNRRANLFCENVIFNFKTHDDEYVKDRLTWIHWYLKLIYSETDIVFGKFYVNENSQSKNGHIIPNSPLNFISIRSTIRNIDFRFFHKVPELLEDYQNKNDKGQDVIKPFFIHSEKLLKFLEPVDKVSKKTLLDLVYNTLNFRRFFDDMLLWALEREKVLGLKKQFTKNKFFTSKTP